MVGATDGRTGAYGEGSALVLAAHGCDGTVSVLAVPGPGGMGGGGGGGALYPAGRVAGYSEPWKGSSRVAL